jgi:tetratricopeptide (TPR) repeat protein
MRGKAALAAVLAAVLAAPQAGAVVTVFGGGLGRDCYEAVKDEQAPFSRARDICDLALIEERLTSRDRAATHVNRGILYMREKQYGRAISDYERAIDLRPDLQEAHINLGAALYSLGRYEDSLAALERGIGVDDLKARAIAHYNRALVKERFGDVTAAYYDFKAAVELDPEFTLARQQLDRFQVTVVPNS